MQLSVPNANHSFFRPRNNMPLVSPFHPSPNPARLAFPGANIRAPLSRPRCDHIVPLSHFPCASPPASVRGRVTSVRRARQRAPRAAEREEYDDAEYTLMKQTITDIKHRVTVVNICVNQMLDEMEAINRMLDILNARMPARKSTRCCVRVEDAGANKFV